jgi:translation initiation factor 1
MARGKKLDIFVGAKIDDGWAEIKSSSKKKTSKETFEPQKHFLVFKKEKRRGKIVTLVGEFHTPKDETLKILKNIKKKLGCGGTFKDGWMEFQGELKDKLRPLLLAAGFRFKK